MTVDVGNKIIGFRIDNVYKAGLEMANKNQEKKKISRKNKNEKKIDLKQVADNHDFYEKNCKKTLVNQSRISQKDLEENFRDLLFQKQSEKMDNEGFKGFFVNNATVTENLHYYLYNENVVLNEIKEEKEDSDDEEALEQLRNTIINLKDGIKGENIMPQLMDFRDSFRNEEHGEDFLVNEQAFSLIPAPEEMPLEERLKMEDEMNEEEMIETVFREIGDNEVIMSGKNEFPINENETDNFGFDEPIPEEDVIEQISLSGEKAIASDEFSNMDKAELSRIIFDEDFDIWKFLDPSSKAMSKLKRAKTNKDTKRKEIEEKEKIKEGEKRSYHT